jgi:hypothetical protein
MGKTLREKIESLSVDRQAKIQMMDLDIRSRNQTLVYL